MTYIKDDRPMAQQILDASVQAWVRDRTLSDEAADRCRRVLARWRRRQRAEGAS